jgi:aldose 1-epimerase
MPTASLMLTAGAMRCEIAPEMGACLAGLWLGDVAVLRSPGAAQLSSVRQSGSYPLVPFSNRVGHASLQWHGTSHPLIRNFGDEPHAIHGVGWQRPWGVLQADAQSALLSFEHQPDLSWPFAFDASQAFRLSADTLEMSLSITNQSATPAPVGLGWHPYFVKRAGCHIAFEATGRWEMDDVNLPTHRLPNPGLNQSCATLQIDHCFDGWGGTVHLNDALLHTRLSSPLGCLVVFTNASKDFVAVEPVSHVNNALNLMAQGKASAQALGVQVLQPGESLSTHMAIQVTPQASK